MTENIIGTLSAEDQAAVELQVKALIEKDHEDGIHADKIKGIAQKHYQDVKFAEAQAAVIMRNENSEEHPADKIKGEDTSYKPSNYKVSYINRAIALGMNQDILAQPIMLKGVEADDYNKAGMWALSEAFKAKNKGDNRRIMDLTKGLTVMKAGGGDNLTKSDTGGYTVPEGWKDFLIKLEYEYSDYSKYTRPYAVTEMTGRIPTQYSHTTATWGYEGKSFVASDVKFGEQNWYVNKLMAYSTITSELLMYSAFDLPTIIAEDHAQQFANAIGTAFINGAATVGATPGSMTGMYGGGYTWDATNALKCAASKIITPADLMNAYFLLANQYRSGSCWIMNSGTMKNIRMLLDGNKNYFWAWHDRPGEITSLMGHPIYINDNLLWTYDASGAKVGTSTFGQLFFGNFNRFYWLINKTDIQMDMTDQVNFISDLWDIKTKRYLTGMWTMFSDMALTNLIPAGVVKLTEFDLDNA